MKHLQILAKQSQEHKFRYIYDNYDEIANYVKLNSVKNVASVIKMPYYTLVGILKYQAEITRYISR